MLLEKECTRKVILNLEKEKFIGMWDEAITCIKRAIDFLEIMASQFQGFYLIMPY